ncbi:MAG: hypothetical protein SCK28_01980 [Bacillota bacterium]|nr:hypothetical protein [Bacillota bacterium]
MAWGYNDFGNLGNGSTSDNYITEPTQIKRLVSIKQIYAGNDFSLALKSDGTVYSWGDNTYGQLGIGVEDWNVSTLIKIEGLSDVKAIAAGNAHAMAIKSDGTVRA